jgi:hypothetical protein
VNSFCTCILLLIIAVYSFFELCSSDMRMPEISSGVEMVPKICLEKVPTLIDSHVSFQTQMNDYVMSFDLKKRCESSTQVFRWISGSTMQ